MNIPTLINPAASSNASQHFFNSVFEYSLSVIDRNSGDIQNLTAAFTFIPSDLDWADWLDGWFSCGYSVFSQPVLVQAI